MITKRKLSIGIRVDSASPSHVHFALFINVIPKDQDHEQATRGKAGDLCLTVEEFRLFLLRLCPDGINVRALSQDILDLEERLGGPLEDFADHAPSQTSI